jgi:hypothetical protein
MVGRIGFAWLQARLMMESTIVVALSTAAKAQRVADAPSHSPG